MKMDKFSMTDQDPPLGPAVCNYYNISNKFSKKNFKIKQKITYLTICCSVKSYILDIS